MSMIYEVEGKDDDIGNHVFSSPQRRCRDSARSSYRGRDWEGDQRRSRGKDHDHHHHKWDHIERRERERIRDRGSDGYDRRRAYDRQSDRKDDRHRSRSRSREDSSERRPMLSQSKCKSKRVSGFDVAPSPSNWMPGATPVSEGNVWST